jgi:putative flippase GtrA
MKTNTMLRFDRSVASLLASNLFTIIIAVVQRWSLSELIWIYWGQSLIIGYFHRQRILALKEFCTNGFSMNGKPMEATPENQRKSADFFILHYGAFHLFFLVFMLIFHRSIAPADLIGIVIGIIVFGFNHRYSFQQNLEKDSSRKPKIEILMFFPYARIVPMHIIIIIGTLFLEQISGVLLFFLLLKTGSDIVMHMVDHNLELQFSQEQKPDSD